MLSSKVLDNIIDAIQSLDNVYILEKDLGDEVLLHLAPVSGQYLLVCRKTEDVDKLMQYAVGINSVINTTLPKVWDIVKELNLEGVAYFNPDKIHKWQKVERNNKGF